MKQTKIATYTNKNLPKKKKNKEDFLFFIPCMKNKKKIRNERRKQK